MEEFKAEKKEAKDYRSHGDGVIEHDQFVRLGTNVVFEVGAMVFHAETISIGNNVYIGHYAILKGYYKNEMIIGDNVWIGQQCFLHSAGGLTIGNDVGIGPGVKILTARHLDYGVDAPLSQAELEFAPVVVGDECNIGVNATVLPGVRLGQGSQIGAGAVVVADVPPFAVVTGVPGKVIRMRSVPDL